MATGQRYLEKKDYARAVLEFKNALQVAPDSAEVHYRLGMAYFQAGNAKEAVELLTKATELDPKHVGAQVELARMMGTSYDPAILAQAGKRADAAHMAAPDDPSPLDALAWSEWKRHKPEEAERHLQEALQKMPGHLKSSELLAKIKLSAKDSKGAEEILRKAVEANPKVVEARLALGNLYSFLDKQAEADQQYQEALKLQPGYAPALMEVASLRVRAGNKEAATELYKRIAALPDKSYRSAYALYLLYLVDANQGISELEKLNAADPSDADTRNLLTSAYLQRNRPAEAQKLFDAELKRNPKNMEAVLQRGRLYLMQGKDKEAERDLTIVLQADPTFAQAHVSMAALYAARGACARQRQELAEAVRLDPGSLDIRLSLASELIKANTPNGALDVLRGAPEVQQRRTDYVAALNWALMFSGDLAAARKGVDAGLATVRSPEFLMQDARLKQLQHNVAGSRKSLEEVLKGNPGHLGALEQLMESYAAARDIPTGLQKVKGYVAQRPGSAPGQLFLAGWLRRTGDLRGARTAAMAAKKSAQANLAVDLMLIELDMMEGKNDDARRNLAAVSADARNKPEVRMLAAMMEQQAGNYAAAVQHYRAVVAASPQSVIALNNLAYLLVDRANSPDEGLQYAQKVKELAPNDPKVEDTIGWAFFRKGLYPTAVGHLENAVNGGSPDCVTRYHLAMAYFKAGSTQQAQRTLAAALRLDSKVPEAKTARELIAAGRAQ